MANTIIFECIKAVSDKAFDAFAQAEEARNRKLQRLIDAVQAVPEEEDKPHDPQ